MLLVHRPYYAANTLAGFPIMLIVSMFQLDSLLDVSLQSCEPVFGSLTVILEKMPQEWSSSARIFSCSVPAGAQVAENGLHADMLAIMSEMKEWSSSWNAIIGSLIDWWDMGVGDYRKS